MGVKFEIDALTFQQACIKLYCFNLQISGVTEASTS